ncbi:permease [Acetobacterium bakii]|uniref:Permease n=1 Tax=Acetobacterium bakii TaxID=52689 RepID=A0A0L6TXT4_9FIRM|nr:permease [Acetobacterium bakii]KNZ40872.1 permease [Acetobacterium bakii]
MIKIVKSYKWGIIFLLVMVGLYLYNQSLGIEAMSISLLNFKEMLLLVPPIFILMGLMEVWVPKETLTKYMGEGSGLKGLFIAFVLGTAAAGPLYIAFPIGVMLLKKGARLSNVLFFLGVWSTTKLPVLLFEVASFGLEFTLIHIGISLPLYLISAVLIERIENRNVTKLLNQDAAEKGV